MKRYLAAGALALCLSQAVQAAPTWPMAPYSYYAQNESLQSVLRDFAGGFSLSLQASSNLGGTVNGRFNVGSPTEFLDRLGGVYGFNWFVYAGTLFVSRASDMATRSISAMGGSITSLRQALQQLGVLDPRFGWGELPEQSLALVSGPPQYVELVERTVAALPMGAGGQQVAVFRLRHASVNDRTIQYRNQQVTTPGLATVLRDLIRGSGSGANNETLSAIAAPLREQPPVFRETDSGVVDAAPPAGQAATSGGSQAGGGRAGLRMLEPTIQADTRLNAIIVQDIPDRIPIYRQLIEQLDVPSTLIEIEAMIVDVNSDRVSELGVTWGARAGSATFGYGDFDLSTSNGLPLDGGATPAPGTIGVSVGNMLVARLRALEGRGDANILSQPSILTADNMGALIDLSETFYIQTRGERVATVTPVTVGTSLRVTPRYIEQLSTADPRVELTVDIEDGRIQDERQIDNLPTVRRSNISTLAVVGDGQTLLIGGYNNTQDSERIDKVPFLGDIPGLGLLFSSRSKTVQQRERLFLIRPRVVAIDGQVVVPPESQASRSTGQAIGTAGQFVDEAQRRRSRVLIEPPSDPSRIDTSQPALPDMPASQSSVRGPVVRVLPESAPVVVPERVSAPKRPRNADPWDAPWYDGP